MKLASASLIAAWSYCLIVCATARVPLHGIERPRPQPPGEGAAPRAGMEKVVIQNKPNWGYTVPADFDRPLCRQMNGRCLVGKNRNEETCPYINYSYKCLGVNALCCVDGMERVVIQNKPNWGDTVPAGFDRPDCRQMNGRCLVGKNRNEETCPYINYIYKCLGVNALCCVDVPDYADPQQ